MIWDHLVIQILIQTVRKERIPIFTFIYWLINWIQSPSQTSADDEIFFFFCIWVHVGSLLSGELSSTGSSMSVVLVGGVWGTVPCSVLCGVFLVGWVCVAPLSGLLSMYCCPACVYCIVSSLFFCGLHGKRCRTQACAQPNSRAHLFQCKRQELSKWLIVPCSAAMTRVCVCVLITHQCCLRVTR